MAMPRILVLFGTRPEAIKMAPVVRCLRSDSRVQTLVCVTGQHREMLRQALADFHLEPDLDLAIMRDNQSINALAGHLISALDAAYDELAPELVMVHGDTTTSFVAALAAFHRQIPVAHVEAGLRTGDLSAPWPEEANRRLTAVLAGVHFAPTESARQNLLLERVADERIAVTGNTVIDALFWMRRQIERERWRPAAPSPLAALEDHRPLVLVTAHRRESFGEGFLHICRALAGLAREHPHVDFVYPVHLNPRVREPVYRHLGNVDNLYLVEPQAYKPFVWLMNRARVILTDSGGVQEEAVSLGKPVVVMRSVTERGEALEAGLMELVGTDPEEIYRAVHRLLTRSDAPDGKAVTLYGDGRASERICEHVLRKLEIDTPVECCS